MTIETKERMDRYEIDVEPPTFHQGAELYNKDCILKICKAIGLSKAVFNYGRMD